MAYCARCGNRMEPGIRFCTACGAPVDRPTASLPVMMSVPAMAVTASPSAVTASPRSISSVTGKSDLRLKLVAGVSLLLSVLGCVSGLLGVIPAGVGVVLVTVAVSIGLRAAWVFAARSASSAAQKHTMLLVSNVGLGISAIALLASLPRITQTGGMARFAEDAAAQLWTMALLTAIALPVRTLGWRVFAGTALTGFFGITGLARFVGRPVLESLGSSSIFAVALWIPLTEELVKLIPVAIVLWVATRRFKSRPSALDVMLLGAWTGAGFAVYESAALGRGQFNLFAPPLVSFVFPGEGYGLPFGWPVVQTGHLGHTALIALSLALAVLYGRRTRRLTWIFPPIAFGAVLLEHCSQNAMVANGLNELVAKIAIVLSLGGYLSALLLLAAICFALFLEWKITGPERKPAGWLLQKPVDGLRRAALLAQAQTGGVR